MSQESQASAESQSQDSEAPGARAREHQALTMIMATLWATLSAVIDDALRLLALEGRLAALSLAAMLAGGVLAALLAVSAWLFALAALAVWLVSAGYTWQAVFFAIAAVNLVAALALAYWVRRLSQNLLFRSTRRSLQAREPGEAANAHADRP